MLLSTGKRALSTAISRAVDRCYCRLVVARTSVYDTGVTTPKHHGSLNTLHQTLGDEFTSCWGRVEEFLAAGEQEIAHTKPFFFPFSSAVTCTNRPLEVDQRRRPYERDGPIGRVLRSYRDSKPVVL
ncbi:hypothetical protein Taro_042411 [Colocasia esculenta]|uniref:Uncharacterized protein n=1 Tax=Colocasia esculenta TaxID=4460 RepID=A0A843WZI5_COLES|nr:hypothetical protein [Colocasia esculenta]